MTYRVKLTLRGPGCFPTWLRNWERMERLRKLKLFDIERAQTLDTAFRQWYLMTEWGQ